MLLERGSETSEVKEGSREAAAVPKHDFDVDVRTETPIGVEPNDDFVGTFRVRFQCPRVDCT